MWFMMSLLDDLGFLRCSGGIAFHFDIVFLRRTGRAAALGDDLFQQCFHLIHLLRHRGGEVLGFPDVIG